MIHITYLDLVDFAEGGQPGYLNEDLRARSGVDGSVVKASYLLCNKTGSQLIQLFCDVTIHGLWML